MQGARERPAMMRLFRWLLRISGGMILLVVLVLALVYWFAARSLPDYGRSIEISAQIGGPGAPVEIVRDNANVPHIFAETDADVFFGLGYAHAQDRLWQMVT